MTHEPNCPQYAPMKERWNNDIRFADCTCAPKPEPKTEEKHIHCWAEADPHRCALCCKCNAPFAPPPSKEPWDMFKDPIPELKEKPEGNTLKVKLAPPEAQEEISPKKMADFAYKLENPNGRFSEPPSMVYEMADKAWKLWHLESFIRQLLKKKEEEYKQIGLIYGLPLCVKGDDEAAKLAEKWINEAEQRTARECVEIAEAKKKNPYVLRSAMETPDPDAYNQALSETAQAISQRFKLK